MNSDTINEFIKSIKTAKDPSLAIIRALFMTLLILLDRRSYDDEKPFWPIEAINEWINYLLLAYPSVSNRFQESDSYFVIPPNGSVKRAMDLTGNMIIIGEGSRHLSTYTPTKPSRKYEVCISFAGEQREFAEAIAKELKSSGWHVFYDADERFSLWGKDLYSHLYRVYAEESLACLILFSESYRLKAWTNHELRAAQSRTLVERSEYIIPVVFGDEKLPPEFANIAYLHADKVDVKELVEALTDRVWEKARDYYIPLDSVFTILLLDEIAEALQIRLHEQDDSDEARVKATLASIALACDEVTQQVRGFFNYLVYSFPPIASCFHGSGALVAPPDIWLGRYRVPMRFQGPLLFHKDFLDPLADKVRETLARKDTEDSDEMTGMNDIDADRDTENTGSGAD